MIPATSRASLGYLRRHPWQLALTVIGVAIGVAVIVAVDLANASARKAFLLSMDAVTGEATHQIVGGPRGVDEAVYRSLRVDHGLRDVAPIVTAEVRAFERSLSVMGVDLFAEQALRQFTRTAVEADGEEIDGQALFRDLFTLPGAVSMSNRSAERLGVDVGDRFEVLSGGRRFDATLLGVFANDDGGIDDLLVTDISTAQEWAGSAGFLSRIDVRIEADDAASLARIEALLPAGTRVLNAAGRTRATAEMSAGFMTNLAAMSLLALLVGLFLIYNSVNFSVLQRRELIGSLRALGMTRRQLFVQILGEALLVGLVASGLGLALGVLLGERMLALVSQSINDFYFRVTATDVSVAPLSIAKGLLAGIGAALVASAVPALEAVSFAPRLAMSRSTLEQKSSGMLRILAVLGVATMVLASLVVALSGKSLVAGLTAVFMMILGFALCVPLMVAIAARWLAVPAGRVAGTSARMAIAGIGASLSRTGVAIVALAVAVSATIGVSVMVSSFRDSVSEWLDQSLQADVFAGVEDGAIDPALIEEIVALDGVVDYSTTHSSWIETAEDRTRLIVIAMAPGGYAGTEVLDADPDVVWPAWEREDAVLVSEPYAYRNGVGRGDSLTLATDSGDATFDIAATYQSYDINASSILVSRTTYDRHFDDDAVETLGLYLADGVDAATLAERVIELAAGRQVLRATSNDNIRELSLDIFDRTFVITGVLYWLTLGVALIGILGAMLALQLERVREFGVLRALGMTPRGLGGMITGQTAAIGLMSGLAAIPLGTVMAWMLIEVINRRAFGWGIDMRVPPDVLVESVAFAVLAAVIAGLYPAWRAARTRPAVAMREE
ncbi:MAG: FtsX-like permease family protein [Pseudomonadota bacterium]